MEATAPRGIHCRLHIEVTESLRKRFEVSVDRTGECWLWTAAQRNGYGAIKHQKKVHSAHVVAWVLAHGNIPDGMIVTHSCDNRLCCRVHEDHCRLGTPTSNVREMYARINVKKSRGELAYNATLTDDEVRFLLAAHELNGAGARSLSRIIGKSEKSTGDVIYRKSWTHIAIPTRQECEQIV
jgi:hypothetical protein